MQKKEAKAFPLNRVALMTSQGRRGAKPMKIGNGSFFAKVCAATVLLCGIMLAGAGCSRIEKVKVVNHFGQPVRIRLGGRNTAPLVPANGETVKVLALESSEVLIEPL